MSISLWGWLHIIEKYGKNAYDIYAETLQVDGLGFKCKKEIRIIFGTKDKLEVKDLMLLHMEYKADARSC